MVEEVALGRLYVMRGMYLVNCVLVGSGVWYEFMHVSMRGTRSLERRLASGRRSPRCG
jgi:hypothetical protein